MGNFLRVCIAVILILSIFTVSVFATPTGTYDMYSFDGRTVVGSSGSGNQYIANFTRSLAYIHSIIANISTTIDYYLPAMNNNIHYIHVALVDAFSPGAGDTRNMWTLMSQAVSGITAIQSAALGIAQDVYNISSYVDGIEGKLDTLHSDNTSSNSKLDTLHSDLTTVNTNIQSLESINWQNSNVTIKFSTDNINYYDNFNSLSNYDVLYIKLFGAINYNNLYWLNINTSFDTEFMFNNNLEVTFYNNFNGNLVEQNVEYYCDYYSDNLNLFIYPYRLYGYNNNYNSVIKIKSDVYFSFNSINTTVKSFKYLNLNSADFYTVDNFIQNHKKSEDTTLSDIKNILIDIDNNSDFIQNNNDLQINVDIDPSVGTGVTGVISKIQDLLDFGISLQEFIVVLNQFDNLQWFTRPETYEQVNQDPRFSPGYIDLYD